MTPRFSSRRTRWCTADTESPVSLARSVKLIRPSAASSATIRRSISSTLETVAPPRTTPRRHTVTGSCHYSLLRFEARLGGAVALEPDPPPVAVPRQAGGGRLVELALGAGVAEAPHRLP